MVKNAIPQIFQSQIALVTLLKVCAKQKDLSEGNRLHAEIVRHGFLEQNVFIGGTLIDMYTKCGALAKAQQSLEELQSRDAVSWTALIRGYAQHGHNEQVFVCFENMKLEKVFPDAVTYACILKACGGVGDAKKGEEIHLEIARKQLLKNDVVLGNALIDMYAKCGVLSRAQEVFDELPVQDVVSWNALITGYANFGGAEQAVGCLEQMQCKDLSPNAVTFLCVLQACGSSGAIEKGSQLHAQILMNGLLAEHGLLENALVDMYSKCGAFKEAEHVLSKISNKSEVCWTALIAGYCEYNHHEKALASYQKMQNEGLPSDGLTCAWALKACARVGCLEKGKEVHADIARLKLLEDDSVLANALVDLYAKCGALGIAKELIKELHICDIVSWTAVMMGYLHHGDGEEAIKCFDAMQLEGFCPDIITLLCILQVCGSIGAVQKGEKINANIVKRGLLGNEYELGNVLLNMYSKCGEIAKAQQVFDELLVRDVVSWTALMTGYVQVGKHEVVCRLFDKMIEVGIKPNLVTFTVVLNACSDSCRWGKGQTFFEHMSTSYGVAPTLEHHTCIVDLLGRAGHCDKAIELAANIPSAGDVPVWLAVMGSCRRWENHLMGSIAFENVMCLSKSPF